MIASVNPGYDARAEWVSKALPETDFPHPTSIYPDVQSRLAERMGDHPYEVRKKLLQDNAVTLWNFPF